MKSVRISFVVASVALIFAGQPAIADRLELVAGGGTRSQGSALECKLDKPFACGIDRNGTMYVVEYTGRLVAINRTGELRVVAGGHGPGAAGDNGPAIDAQLNAPHHLIVLPDGDVLVADTMNCRVRKYEAKTGRILAFAGTGETGFSGDHGPAIAARFGAIYCLALDQRRNSLYVDDLDNRRIRRIDLRTGIVSTVAGNGLRGAPADGTEAVDGPLDDPRAITVDSKGNLYILERSGNALRVVDRKGFIRTVVGTGEAGGIEDGTALRAGLRSPKHLTVDASDNVLIADSDNHAIRKYVPRTGQIVRVAGTGAPGVAGVGGPPKEAELNQPHGVFVGKTGVTYICDSWNDRVLRIVPN